MSDKPKGGRPSDYTEEIAERICVKLAGGESLRSICDGDESLPDWRTVLRWVVADREGFASRYARAREAQGECKADEIEQMLSEEPERGPDGRIDAAWVTHQRNKIATKQWLAAKLRPKVYGDRQHIEHSGAIDMAERIAAGRRRVHERLGREQPDD